MKRRKHSTTVKLRDDINDAIRQRKKKTGISIEFQVNSILADFFGIKDK